MSQGTYRSSFGIELEGYIAWVRRVPVKTETGVIRKITEFSNPNPYPWGPAANPLVIDSEINKLSIEPIVHAKLADIIQQFLAETPGPRDTVVPSEFTPADLGTADRSHLMTYRNWSVKHEVMSHEAIPWSCRAAMSGPNRGWLPFELCSPALWATEVSYEEVRRVIQYLRENLWLVTPHNSGLHVHYGNGFDYIPLGALRRIAGFLYAADPVLVQVHPNRRKVYSYCLSPVLYSRLAHGCQAEWMEQELEEFPEEIPQKDKPIKDKPIKDKPKSAPLQEHRSRPRRRQTRCVCLCCICICGGRSLHQFLEEPREYSAARNESQPKEERPTAFRDNRYFGARGALGSYEFNTSFQERFRLTDGDGWAKTEYDCPPPRPSPAMPIVAAVQELLKCRKVETVASLMMVYGSERPAYNFIAYGLMRHYYADMKRTIEFRQGAGSFDSEALVAWCRTCVRLCDFARDVSDDVYWKIIIDCSEAVGEDDEGDDEEHVQWYDAFDLLAELGLPKEAQVLHRFAQRENAAEAARNKVVKQYEQSSEIDGERSEEDNKHSENSESFEGSEYSGIGMEAKMMRMFRPRFKRLGE